jgi:hypothetical protein
VAKVGTSKAGGTISQQAVVPPWLAMGAQQTNKQVPPKNKKDCVSNFSCAVFFFGFLDV